MAKRDIPEINAGSMADIAFLLLIFFLVTTTMDRDKAYVRSIPKKIEDVQDPPPIQDREIFEIKANAANQLMVRGEKIPNSDDISERVLEFYRKNENLSVAETNAAAQNPNHPGFEFPFYSQYTASDLDEELEKAKQELKTYEDLNPENPEESMIEFFMSGIKEWEKKKKALKLYGKSQLPQISPQTHIRVVVQVKTGYELFAKIQSEVEEAIFELRDDAAKDIWNIGYGKIITNLGSDPTDKEYIAKMDLLKMLYPATIIEVTPTN